MSEEQTKPKTVITPEMLAAHKLWKDTNGAEGTRLVLIGANLAHAYLARAYLARADLAHADLAGANLAGAYLAHADLAGADLAGANLAGAYLAHADLAGANLAGAYLAGANLADANLAGANLARADLAGANLAPLYEDSEVPLIPQLNSKILAAVENGGALEMSDVHACETTHCVAGWAVHLGGEAGYALEKKIGWRWAGAAIFRKSTGTVPHFFARNERALRDLRARAAKEVEQQQSETPPR